MTRKLPFATVCRKGPAPRSAFERRSYPAAPAFRQSALLRTDRGRACRHRGRARRCRSRLTPHPIRKEGRHGLDAAAASLSASMSRPKRLRLCEVAVGTLRILEHGCDACLLTAGEIAAARHPETARETNQGVWPDLVSSLSTWSSHLMRTGHTPERPDCVADDAVSCELVSTPNSLLTGKLTGNFAESGHPRRFPHLINELIQRLAAKFPTQRNREFLQP